MIELKVEKLNGQKIVMHF